MLELAKLTQKKKNGPHHKITFDLLCEEQHNCLIKIQVVLGKEKGLIFYCG